MQQGPGQLRVRVMDSTALRAAIFPFLRWRPEVSGRTLHSDLLAGMTGAVIVLPQGVAFAIIAGLPPEYGLYTAIVPAIVAALFGSSFHLVSGPTTAISIVLFTTVSPHAQTGSTTYIEMVLTLTFLADCQCRAGKLLEAEAAAREALAVNAARLGKDHPRFKESEGALGCALAKQRRYAQFESRMLKERGVKPWPHKFIRQPLREFWRRYVSLQGYRDGWLGFKLAALLGYYYGFMPHWYLLRR